MRVNIDALDGKNWDGFFRLSKPASLHAQICTYIHIQPSPLEWSRLSHFQNMMDGMSDKEKDRTVGHLSRSENRAERHQYSD